LCSQFAKILSVIFRSCIFSVTVSGLRDVVLSLQFHVLSLGTERVPWDISYALVDGRAPKDTVKTITIIYSDGNPKTYAGRVEAQLINHNRIHASKKRDRQRRTHGQKDTRPLLYALRFTLYGPEFPSNKLHGTTINYENQNLLKSQPGFMQCVK